MSKIERALRKAEEEKSKRVPVVASAGEQRKETFIFADKVVEVAGIQTDHAHISESFRKIAARLKSYCDHVGARDVTFTSAVSGEGKTTSAINCALSLCQDFNLSVCLVDFDFRNPTLSKYFPSNGAITIGDVLNGKADIDSVIHPTSVPGLSIVFSSKVGRLSLSLLNSERITRVISELRSRFDFLIFDSPPILPLADTVVLSKSVSAIVLVIESARTRRKHIEQVFEQIERDKFVGFVMNYKKHHVQEHYNYSKYYDYGSADQ